MPVALSHIRDELMPGLWDIYQHREFGLGYSITLAQDELPELPVVSLPAAAAMGVAAVVIKNPTVTRRFLSWLSHLSN